MATFALNQFSVNLAANYPKFQGGSFFEPPIVIEIFRGNTPTLNFLVTNADGSETDLSTSTITAQAKANQSDGSPAISWSLAHGIAVTTSTLGNHSVISITPSVGDTSSFTVTTYLFFDILIISPGGQFTVSPGTLKINATTTN